MAVDTFLTSYKHDYIWPWDLPVKLVPWPPPKRTIERPRKCPPLPCPECPCPDHSWLDRAGHYACLAEKEAAVHRHVQKARFEIERCLHRTKEAEEKNKTDRPPLMRDDPKISTYQIDYARRDTVPVTFVQMLEEIEASPVPQGPLGKRLYGMYTDPCATRTSFYTKPLYDRNILVERPPFPNITEIYFNCFPGITEYMDKYSYEAIRVIKRAQRFKYPSPLIDFNPSQQKAIAAY